ncbi:enoyl-CoA hydratase/isomerase family protein [Paracoccus seriniphilus]|uniref:Short chain enoyl-CoA hydratase /Enoyl-CoA hydratase n=1 Tax=Paracoccus seriniphilus TaxID=184748 RepID=A0A239Q2Y9_9RHOB|nr:enoyl-CoA hydratase/isomerase family protein [Paracoccus seriniphilus]WCR15612.1 enoyl-CoA hydratase/isomerase family protein [Paracoccus seriniphilus]SNT76636.1 short chain enoyl-CoA hydratase /Enoyl-CoA hydratase [Paracoccus seriniphilus]
MSIDTQKGDDGVLVITLNEPDRRNPVGHATRQNLLAVLAEAGADDSVRAVVLTGAGGHFSAGGDIRDQGERSLAAHRARFAVISDLVSRMARFPKPLVAAVEGWAAGGGFSLAMACPTVVASRDARFVASFTKIALMPDLGLLSTLPARVGPARARRLILTNRVVGAPEAHELGIVDELADVGGALDTAVALVLEEAEGPAMARQFIVDWFARDLSPALEYEQAVQPMLINSADAAEGRAAFAEKRPPQFRGC